MKTARLGLLISLSAMVILLAAISTPWPVQGQSAAVAPTPAPMGAATLWQYADPTHNPYALHGQAAQLARQYVKAEKEEEKRELRKKLTDVLNKEFDARLEQQQKELEELEKQIAHLRTVLRKRSDSKEKIVDRRIEQLIEEAEGLGWSSPTTPQAGYGIVGVEPARFQSKVTQANLEKIKTGMSEQEVLKLLGKPTDDIYPDQMTKVMTWRDGENYICVTFHNGKVQIRQSYVK